MDDSATIGELKQLVLRFRDDRDWKQFHDPKNLAMGLSIEASELLELFLWKSKGEVKKLLSSEQGARRLREEIADVFIFLLYLSEACGVDLSESVSGKIALNEEKYPREKSRGSSRKYDELNTDDNSERKF